MSHANTKLLQQSYDAAFLPRARLAGAASSTGLFSFSLFFPFPFALGFASTESAFLMTGVMKKKKGKQ